jgi:integrase
MRYTINLDCKTHHVGKDGGFPILLRISINGVHDYLNTGQRIKEIQYDKAKKQVKSQVNGSTKLSAFIERQKVIVDDIITDFEKKGEIATLSKVKTLYEQNTGKIKSESFYDYVEETVKWERENTSISGDTLDNYLGESKKLKNYRPSLTIHDIDKNFLQEYKNYILKTLKQKGNTACHAMCFLRKYTKRLYKLGKIRPYPFDDFKVGSPFEAELEFLEPEELNALHDLYDSKRLLTEVKSYNTKYAADFHIGEQLQKVLRYFLVACYTGLRHSDIKTLSPQHIKGKYIVKELVKGREGRKKLIRIPIRKRLQTLLSAPNPEDSIFRNNVMENAQTNKYLSKIMKICGINKHITFHIARHSFSIISLLLGVKFEVVSNILGHSELTTTQRYARVVDRLREQEMDKWDRIIKDESTNNIEIYCPNCDNEVIKLPKEVIRLTNLPCTCIHCGTQFIYNFQSDISKQANSSYLTLSA